MPQDLQNQARIVQMTESELKSLLETTVTDTLTKLGVDINNPREMQKDFQHLRDWREATAAFHRKGLLTLIGIILAGICGAFWLGLKEAIGN